MSGIASTQQQLVPIYLSTLLFQTLGLVGFVSVGLLSFQFLRPKFPKVYLRKPGNTSLFQPTKLFSLLKTLLLEKLTCDPCYVNLDSYLFLTYLKLNLKYNLSLLLPGLILVVINGISGLQNPKSTLNSTGWLNLDLKLLSIESIKNQVQLLWFYVGVAYFNNLTFLIFNVQFCREVVKVRQRYFQSETYKRQVHSQVLVVTGLQGKGGEGGCEKELKGIIKSWNLTYEPNRVHILSSRLVHLQSLTREYNMNILNFEEMLSRVQLDTNFKRPSVYSGKLSGLRMGSKVDGIDFYLEKLTRLHSWITELQGPKKSSKSSLAFLKYKDTTQCHHTYLQLMPGPGTKLPVDAPFSSINLMPGPNQLILKNLGLDWRHRVLRFTLSTLAFLLLLVGAAFLFSSLAYLGSSTTLASTFPSAASFFSQPFLQFLLDGLITPLIMMVLITLMQVMLKRMARFQSAETKGSVDRRLLAKFLTFLVVDNLVVFSLLSTFLPLGNALNSIQITDFLTFIQTFKSIIPSIGLPFTSALISTSTFWVSQLGLRTLAYLVELVQPVSLLNYVHYKLRNSENWSWVPRFNLTLRQQKLVESPPRFDFPIVYAVTVFNMTLIQTFGLVAPLILPYGIVNFLVAFLVYRYQLTSVYSNVPNRQGRLALTAIHCSLTLFTLIQFLNLLVVLLKNPTDSQWLCLLPLPFFTAWWVLTLKTWLDANAQALKGDNHSKGLGNFNLNYSERPTPIYPTQLNLTQSEDSEIQLQPYPSQLELESELATEDRLESIVPLHYLTKKLLQLEVEQPILNAFPELNQLVQLTPNNFSTEGLHELV